MKRIIFTFLFCNGKFILSRNFFRQNIGDHKWLFNNYNLEKVAFGLDEIMLINISSNSNYDNEFNELIEKITKNCFIPLTVGGRIKTLSCAENYFKLGADKLLINTLNYINPNVTKEIISTYGSQAIMGCVDFKLEQNVHNVYINNAKTKIDYKLSDYIHYLLELGIGEILLQSIDNDGTGNGLDFSVLEFIPTQFPIPVILMGGIGKTEHFLSSLQNKKIDAVSTANILNFIGSSILNVRKNLINEGVSIPEFNKKFDLF